MKAIKAKKIYTYGEKYLDNGIILENNKRIYIEPGEKIKPREMRELKSKYMTVSNVIKVTRE